LIASYPDHQLAANTCVTLGYLLYHAFECMNDIEYLNGAISATQNNLNASNIPFVLSVSHGMLILYLFACLPLLKLREDLNEILQLLTVAAKNEGMEFDCLLHLCRWAFIAHNLRHPSISTAYDCAMSSLQACLTLAPTLDMQHSQLVVKMDDFIKSLPFNYMSYQIDINQLKQAIETLK